MDRKRKKDLVKFQEQIGYTYNNLDLLDIAFTHSSYINENKSSKNDNERLEFLGDSVVNLIVTDLLFNNFKNMAEGDLTRIRASIICEDSFAWASKYLNIPPYLLLGKGEELNGGRHRKSLISDAFEAFCGSLYLDSNFDTAKDFLLDKFTDIVLESVESNRVVDYKTMLQEEVQKSGTDKVRYRMVKEEGPDHQKIFYYEALVADQVVGKGKGSSKKEAEHNAAHDSLCNMSIIDD